MAMLERVHAQSADLARELGREGSPLAGLMDAERLDRFTGLTGDVLMALANCPPVPDGVPDPLAGVD